MSLNRIDELQVAVEDSPMNLEHHRELLLEEVAFLEAQEGLRVAAEERIAQAAKNKAELQERLRVLQAERESSAAHTPTPAECSDYAREWLEHAVEFRRRRLVLSYFLNYSPAEVKHVDLTVVAGWLDSWPSFLERSDGAVRRLRHFERRVKGTHPLPSAQRLSEALDEVCRLQLQARSVVGHERYRRNARSADCEEDLLDSQTQLLDWCARQLETLEELSGYEDLAEFSASFHSNVPVMESNFLVLMEQGEGLADRPRVQDALQEVNEAWVRLCVRTYVKLRAAAEEAHTSSRLEEQCATWNATAAGPLRLFLTGTQRVLADAAAGDPRLAALKERCDTLLQEHDAHGIVCTHISDFTVREECLRPHTEALAAELSSHVTSKVLTFPCYDAYEGRDEYKTRMEELREWIEVNTEKRTYENLLGKLDDTKAMIKEYADALFPDE